MDVLRQLEVRMALASSRVYTTRVIDACTDAMNADESKLHNVKRRVLRILIAVGVKYPSRCRDIVAIIIEGAISHHGRQRLVSACKAALEELFRHQRMQVAKYIEDETKRIAQRDGARQVIKRTLGEWQLNLPHTY